jgi:hypothetical protein
LIGAKLQIANQDNSQAVMGKLTSEFMETLSQISRRMGAHWLAAWHHLLASWHQKAQTDEQKQFNALVRGSRALRLGYSSLALHDFSIAVQEPGASEVVDRAKISIVQTLRLMGKGDKAEEKANEYRNTLSPRYFMELHWECLCLELAKTTDLNKALLATKKGGSHFAIGYLVELSLWAKVLKEKSWLNRTRKMKGLVEDRSLRPRRLGMFFQAALTLEHCYDTDIPIDRRVASLGKVLERLHQLLTIEKELLILAAATRWLVRVKRVEMAEFTLSEYRGQCLKLSNGQSLDTLGVLQDVGHRAPLLADQIIGECA